MDFSQNITIPSVTFTPSQWYFCSLLAANLFGIFFENDGTQTNYVYGEFASGKGSDQINALLQHFIPTVLVPAGKNISWCMQIIVQGKIRTTTSSNFSWPKHKEKHLTAWTTRF
ncbi:hypothetical protein L916_12911 [Phytophthora nicotianae]|uniref:Uncharacterized protein n=1 Tax=Phytophthora nicotianae TaxID=4792 RepID=W2IL96_PHYNI|nr:hypothetical protein L916_12911 [Phytophthora nicotianae]